MVAYQPGYYVAALMSLLILLLNCSFSTGKVPSYWLNALVTPVPKVSAPIGFSDFRPISVTPHLSRIAEKVIVRRWLQPAIPVDNIGACWISLLLNQVAVLLQP